MINKNFKKVTDEELAYNIKSFGDSNSLKELAFRHQGLFYSVSSRIIEKKIGDGLTVDKEGIEQSKLLIVYNAAKSYNPNIIVNNRPVKVSTHIANIARYFCLNSVTEFNKVNSAIEISDFINAGGDADIDNNYIYGSVNRDYELSVNDFYNNAREIIKEKGDARMLIIFDMKFSGNKTKRWKEVRDAIQQKTGRLYSQQTCVNLYNKILDLVRNNCEYIEHKKYE